jgi:tetratricopeptide (TPR) repeat protein
LQQALDINPELLWARFYLARLHASDKALEALRAALPEGKEFPASEYYQELQADLPVERGAAYTAKKIYARAIDEYARALDCDPRCAVVHRRLAELYVQRGDPASAALHTKRRTSSRKTKVGLAFLGFEDGGGMTSSPVD